jgi:putative oxidoreductase
MGNLIRGNYRRLADVALRIVLGAVFMYAGAMKIGDPVHLADSIAAFDILPRTMVSPLALGLPPFEIAAGLLLLIGWQRRVAALALVIAMAIFSAALLSAILRGLTLDCGCFGAGSAPSVLKMWLDLGRDVVLLAASSISYRFSLPASSVARIAAN